MHSYFQLFNLPEQFNLDLAKLEQQYHQLNIRFHPDKTATASSFEQKQAIMMAATINQAYQTLQNPLDRAAYLLQQQGINADAPEHTHFAPEFLMQQMQWREQLNDAKIAQNTSTLHALAQEIQAEQHTLYQHLANAFEQQQLQAAANLVRQGRFLAKLQQEIQAAL